MPDDPFSDIGHLFESGDNRKAVRAYGRAKAAERGIDPDFADRLWTRESGYNRNALNKETGAAGIGQMIPGTQKRFGLKDPHDAKEGIDKSLEYLAGLHQKFGGDTRRMAAGYFAGEGQSDRALANPSGNPKTIAYANAVGGTGRTAPKPTPKAADPFGDIGDLLEGSSPAKTFTPKTRPTATDPHLKLAMKHLTDESGQPLGPASAMVASKIAEEQGTRRGEARAAARQERQARVEAARQAVRMPNRGYRLAEDEADITPEQAQQIVSGQKTGAEIRATNRPKPVSKPAFSDQPHWGYTGNPMIDTLLTKAAQGVIGGVGSAVRGAGQIIDDPASAADLLTTEIAKKQLNKLARKFGLHEAPMISDTLRGHPLSTTEQAAAPTNPVYGAGQKLSDVAEFGAETEDTFAKRLPRMVGGFAPVVATGPFAPAVMAAQTRDALFQDALAHGATKAQASQAATEGTVLGTALGIIPGGAAARAPMGVAKTLGREALLGGALGAGQKLGENVIANTGAGYDPNRPSLEGVPQAALEQAAIGPMMALPHAMGGRGRPQAEPREVAPARPEWLPEGQATGEGLPLGAQYPAEGLQRGAVQNKLERGQPLTPAEKASLATEQQQATTGRIATKRAEGKPLTKAELASIPTEPEAPGTLQAQIDAVKSGGRKAVLVTPGEQVPTRHGLSVVDTAVGRFLYDANQTSSRAIRRRVGNNTYHDLLGIVEPKSAKTTETVVARSPEGQEQQAAVVSPEKAPEQAAKLQEQFPEATVRTEPAENVIADRRVTAGTPPEGIPERRGLGERARDFIARTIYPEGQVDQLTGLQGTDAWKRAKDSIDANPGREVAYLDANDLKAFNDTHGHEAGDAYLAHVGKVIREEAAKAGIPERDLFRTNKKGDEFAIAGATDQLAPVIERVKARVAEFQQGDVKGSIAAGIGKDSAAADSAMYADKTAFKAGEQGKAAVPKEPVAPPKEVAPEPAKPAAVPEPGKVHKFSSTQVNLPAHEARSVLNMGRSIPEADLAGDGRESQPHITVKYGLHTADAAAVRDILAGEKPITATLGKVSTFKGVEDGTADAVIAEVDSPDLHRLNKLIADALPHTDTHPDYKPHVTIAYVKPGLGEKYAGRTDVRGKRVTLKELTFSSKDGDTVSIPLGGKAKGAKIPPDAGRGTTAAAGTPRHTGSPETSGERRVSESTSLATRNVTRTVLERAAAEIPGLREHYEAKGSTTPEQQALQVGAHMKLRELGEQGHKPPKAQHKRFGDIQLIAKTPDGAKILLGKVGEDGQVTYHMAQNPEHELLSNAHLTAKPEDIAKLPTVSWNELGTLGDAHPPTAMIEALGKKLNLPAKGERAASKDWHRLSDIPDDVAIEHFPEVFRSRVKEAVSDPQWADMALKQMESESRPNEPKIIGQWRDDVKNGGLGANRVDLIAKGMTVAAYDTYRDLKTFGNWSKKMVSDWGESIKPKLTTLWEAATKASRQAQQRVGQWVKKFMDPKRPGQEGFISVGGQPSTRVKPTGTPTTVSPRTKPVAGKDFGGMDWVRSRLSNLDFVGSYERRGGQLGRKASDLMRQAQVDIETGNQPHQQAVAQLRKDMSPIIKQLDANGLPGLAEQMNRHLEQVSGKPQPFQQTASLLKTAQYNLRLRFNPKSMIINKLQPLTTLWPHVSSVEFARLAAQAHSPAVRKRLAPILGTGATKIGSTPTKSRIPDPFAKVSEANKVMGYLHGEKEAKRLGLTGQAAERMAMDWAKKVEFDNSKWDAPPIMTGPVASTLLQFKGFTVKNIESIVNDVKLHQGDKFGGYAARAGKRVISQIALGGARSFPGIKQIGGIVLVGALAKAFHKAGMDEDAANKTAEAVYYGAPALAGEDLSGSLMVIDPPYGDDIYEQLINFGAGPTVSSAARLVQQGKRAYAAHEQGDDDKALAAAKRGVAAVTPYPKMVESGINAGKQLAGGEPVKVKAGDKEEELNKFEATMKAFGFTPVKQTKGYDEKDAYDWQKALMGQSTSRPQSDRGRERGARR